jgi:MinD superfamily P-loop ATPase
MVVAIASGKGGTGKTTFAVALAKRAERDVLLLDCDVEEPNADLFFQNNCDTYEIVHVQKPAIIKEKCNGCAACASICQFNAIVVIAGKAMVFPELCHSCGGCALVCPENAIEETSNPIGELRHFKAERLSFFGGQLDVGQAMSPPLIREVKKRVDHHKLTIIDSPPGTSCPMITAVNGSDYIILVTDATPFGLHDLKLSVLTLRKMTITFGVVINRYDLGDKRVEEYCKSEKIEVLMKIPNDRRIAKAYSEGSSILEVDTAYGKLFGDLHARLEDLEKLLSNEV